MQIFFPLYRTELINALKGSALRWRGLIFSPVHHTKLFHFLFITSTFLLYPLTENSCAMHCSYH